MQYWLTSDPLCFSTKRDLALPITRSLLPRSATKKKRRGAVKGGDTQPGRSTELVNGESIPRPLADGGVTPRRGKKAGGGMHIHRPTNALNFDG